MFDEEGYFEESDDDSSTEGENTSVFRFPDEHRSGLFSSKSLVLEGIPGKSILTRHDLFPFLTS